VEYENVTKSFGASYYWLVRFTSGRRIPYPLLNLEGPESSPFQNGSIEKDDDEIAIMETQESIIREAYEARPELKQEFEALKFSIFGKDLYDRCSECVAFDGHYCVQAGPGVESGTSICETMPEGAGIENIPGAIRYGEWEPEGTPENLKQIPVFDFKKRIVRNLKSEEVYNQF